MIPTDASAVVGTQGGCTGRLKQKESTSSKSRDEFRGPDTSSLTAFLLSLLSCTDSSNQGETEQGATDSYVDSNCGNDVGSSSVNENLFGDQSSSLQARGVELSAIPSTGRVGNEEASRYTAEDPEEADWQLVSKLDLTSPKQLGDQAPKVEEPSRRPAKLPTTSEASSLLSESLRHVIYSALPTLSQGLQWVLLYSTLLHGISLRTLYRRSAILPGPCLLVAGDNGGAIFGALLVAPLRAAPKKKYQGNHECFVFTNVSGIPKVFRATGCNRYFFLCTNEALAVGGGGCTALYLDSELLHGASATCETYGSPCLAHNDDFVLKNVELWGFAHTSRYVPRHSSFREAERSPGVFTW